jgi:hypothetical protein
MLPPTGGLVRDSKPILEARFSCREPRPFPGIEPICLPDDEKSPWSAAAKERFLVESAEWLLAGRSMLPMHESATVCREVKDACDA